MVLAVGPASTERGLLVLAQAYEQLIEAEVTTGCDTALVHLQGTPAMPADLANSAPQYVIRTHDSVIFDAVRPQSPLRGVPYLRRKHAMAVVAERARGGGGLSALDRMLRARLFRWRAVAGVLGVKRSVAVPTPVIAASTSPWQTRTPQAHFARALPFRVHQCILERPCQNGGREGRCKAIMALRVATVGISDGRRDSPSEPAAAAWRRQSRIRAPHPRGEACVLPSEHRGAPSPLRGR